MHGLLNHRLPAALVGAFAACLAGGAVWASGAVGGGAVAALTTSFTVNCAQGQKIGPVLAGLAPGQTPVRISFTGTCVESVVISRDAVTLHAASAGATIRVPAAVAHIKPTLRVVGATGVQLQQFTIVGGAAGLEIDGGKVAASGITIKGADGGLDADYGAQVTFNGGKITQAGGNGAEIKNGSYFVSTNSIFTANGGGVGVDGGRAQLQGCQITWNKYGGIDVLAGGYAFLANCSVSHNNGTGVHTGDGGVADVYNGDVSYNPDGVIAQGGDVTIGTTVAHNTQAGVTGLTGARVTLAPNAAIRYNGGNGLWLSNGAVAELSGSDTFQANGQNGIDIEDNSTIWIEGSGNGVTGNASWGIYCGSSPGTALVDGNHADVTMSGNSSGNSNCSFTG